MLQCRHGSTVESTFRTGDYCQWRRGEAAYEQLQLILHEIVSIRCERSIFFSFNCFKQIFALITFVMSVIHEKYLATSSNQRQTKRNKKKSTSDEPTKQSNIYAPNEKERTHIIMSLVNRLKTELNTIDAAVGKWIV